MSEQTLLTQFTRQYAWPKAPAKRRFRFKKAINRGMVEEHRLALTLGGVIDRALDDNEGLQSSDYSTYQIFDRDDLVFKLIDLENIRTSRVGYVPRRGIMSPAYIRLSPSHKDTCSRYYYWFFYGAYINNIFNGMGGGVRQSLTPTDLLEFPIPLPDLSVQRAVVDFLDRETTRIDQLIEKKQRLVKILSEKDKTTIKLHVLGQIGTRERSQSAFAWLPPLPTEWPLMRCAHIFWNLDSHRIPLNSEERADLEKIYPYYGASGIIDHVDRYIFDEENILVGEDGANLVMQSTPIAFKATGKYWVNNHAHIIHPRFGVMDYWVHVLNQVPYEIFVTGSAQPKLTSEALGNIRIPCPSAEEQQKIVTRLQRIRQNFVSLREPIASSIERLREFRATLITAAVTGQIDVATWVKRGETERRLDKIGEVLTA